MTALNPHIGYTAATAIAAEALATGRTVAALVLERGLLTQEQLDSVMHPGNLTRSVSLTPVPAPTTR